MPSIHRPSISSATPHTAGYGLLFVERRRALFAVSCPETDLDSLLRSVKTFELRIESDGTVALHPMPVPTNGPVRFVLADDCVNGADRLKRHGRPIRLTVVAVAPTGARPMGEFPLSVRPNEIQCPAPNRDLNGRQPYSLGTGELAARAKSPDSDDTLAEWYRFSRGEVEAMDFSMFLSLYDRDRLPSGPRLAALMGNLTISIEGYEDDPREVWEIPEVRKFCQTLFKVWPYAAFFLDLGNWNMAVMYQCCLNSIVTRRMDGKLGALATYDPDEMIRLLKHTMDCSRGLWSRAGVSTPSVFARTKAVFDYFARS